MKRLIKILLYKSSSRKCIPFAGKVKHIPVKRTFDIIFSGCALVFGFPLFVIIALLIQASSRGSIFYSHERVGRGGRVFRCYKFRSMYADADRRLEEILAGDAACRAEWESNAKLRHDPRITPVGRVLRRTSLDELPQFWNVFKGDLSVVGPRPVVEREVSEFLGSKASKILSVRPGLTCLWQISGRSNTTYDQRISLDEEYVERRSLGMDMRIIAQTVPEVFSSKGAY